MKHLKLYEDFNNHEITTQIQYDVYDKLKEFGDMSPIEMRAYASNDIWYMDNGEDVDAIVKDIRDAFEEDNKPSEDVLKVVDAINNGKLKILRAGTKKYGKYKLSIDEYVWARNFMDGFGIDVYLNDNYVGTIRYLAPDYKAESN